MFLKRIGNTTEYLSQIADIVLECKVGNVGWVVTMNNLKTRY